MSSTSLPGYVGLPIIGDKSVEFYRDAIGFVNNQIDKHGFVFATRFLNTPTVFVASNAAVHELLNDKHASFEMGYKQFMDDVYGENVLFTNGDAADRLRMTLKQLLESSENFKRFTSVVDRHTVSMLKKMDSKKSIKVYDLFKSLATEICLSLFLDLDFETSRALTTKMVALTTAHWHGIISVPVNIKLPLTSMRSSYGNSINAKAALLEIIEEKMNGAGFPQQMYAALNEQAANHVLLFTSALVPKALASLLTSFVVNTANSKAVLAAARYDSAVLENILLEMQRLWPPFVGGRRIAKQDTTLAGFHVPAGHAVMFMSQHAQRDPAVFADPNTFIPSRWAGANKDDKDKLFLFGAGERCCIGHHMVMHILKTVSKTLVEKFHWDITPGQSLAYKWLPVCRPKEDLSVMFVRRKGTEDDTEEMDSSHTSVQTSEDVNAFRSINNLL